MRFGILITLFFWTNIIVAQNPNDCVNAINLCGDTNLAIDPLGVGINEFTTPNNPPPSCYNFNAAQVWFKIEIDQTGQFTFTLNPDETQADYDFAIFGPTTSCNNLRSAIRCSSINPAAAGISGATGLNDVATEVSEGPGDLSNDPPNDGFLRALDVVAGETYYIIIGLAVGNGGFTMSTGGSAELPPPPELNDIESQQFCDNDPSAQDGIITTDLTQYDTELIASNNTIVRYYENENDANVNQNEITTPFQNSSPNQTIYVRAERTDSDCVNFGEFELQVDDSDIDFMADPVYFCSTRTTQPINLEDYIEDLVEDFSNYNVTYFNTIVDAYINDNPISNNRTATTTLQEDILKFVDPTGELCEFFVTLPYQVAPPPVFTIDPAIGLYCDNDYDDIFQADLNEMDAAIIDGQGEDNNDLFYYASIEDRNQNQNNITSLEISSTPQTLFAEIRDNVTGCFSFGEVSVRLTAPPLLEPQEPKNICENSNTPLLLEVEPGFTFYEWSNGAQGANAFSTTVNAPGDYTVTVSDTDACSTDLTITVNPSSAATIVDIDTSGFSSGSNTAVISVTGSGDYEYDLDGLGYRDSNEFTDIFKGFHVLTVRDKNGCGEVSQEFAVLDFEEFFTPNDDGFNDVWSIEAIEAFPGSELTIFDRYGKLLYQFTSPGIGWDGTFNGQPLPSSTYWFSLKVPDQEEVRGFFALKR